MTNPPWTPACSLPKWAGLSGKYEVADKDGLQCPCRSPVPSGAAKFSHPPVACCSAGCGGCPGWKRTWPGRSRRVALALSLKVKNAANGGSSVSHSLEASVLGFKYDEGSIGRLDSANTEPWASWREKVT